MHKNLKGKLCIQAGYGNEIKHEFEKPLSTLKL